MVVYENTLKQFYRDVRTKKLVNFLCAEYEAATGRPVPREFRYTWKYELMVLYSALLSLAEPANTAAGIRIDLDESVLASHIKLIFASSREGEYHYSVLGLYAGSGVKLSNADDIVSFREGDTRWTAVHPSMLMSSFVRRLFRGIPEDELQDINYESASWLFDCFFSCDSDILTDYDDQLTDAFPVFYANDEAEMLGFLGPVLSLPGGIEALRKLRSIEKLSASKPSDERSEEQIYLISSIANNVRRSRRAWYILEGQPGSCGDEIIESVVGKLRAEGWTVAMPEADEKPAGRPDLIVICEQNGGTYDQLECATVGIFLSDEFREPGPDSFEEDSFLTALAKEEGAQLYIRHLKQAMAFVDGGRGMRWLVNRLQLADIRREDFDPDLYDIRLVKSREEFGSGDAKEKACVVLPSNITFDGESGQISIRKNQKKGIYNALKGGRKGIWILCQDAALKAYLEKELYALRQRQLWVRSFVSELIEGRETSEKQIDALAKDNMEDIRKEDSRYAKKLKSSLGRGAYMKMGEQSRTWIISALMAYDKLKEYDRMVDFSGVCVQIGKACEYELKKRIFTSYVEYEKEKYGDPFYLAKLPPECMAPADGGGAGQRRLLTEGQVTLGKLRYIMGLDDNGRIVNRDVWEEFSAYAAEALLASPDNPLKVMRSQLPVIGKIRDDYRNRSAHSHEISIVDARECIEYVITVHRKLGVLLDQYKA